MAKHPIRLAALLASVLTVTAGGASAQEASRSRPAEPLVFGTGPTYEVKFDDDPLAALPGDVIVPRITVRQTFGAASLMRPRTQFVVEMLKSTDTL